MHFLNTSTFLNHSFYETSYHWYLGRFYDLNSSQSNSFKTQSSLRPAPTRLEKLPSLMANLSSSTVSHARSDVNNSILSVSNETSLPSPAKITNFTNPNDVFLAYNFNSFLTKERTELLYSLNQNKSNLQARHNAQGAIDARLFKLDDFKSLPAKLPNTK